MKITKQEKYLESISDEVLLRLKNGEKISSISQLFNVTRQNLVYYLSKRRGYIPPKRINKDYVKITDDILIKSFRLYNIANKSITEIANIFNVDRKTLSKKLKDKYSLLVRKDGKKKIYSYAFNKIDSEDSAYWLGMMYADGYVGLDNSIELCLKYSDIGHVRKFKKFLKSSHKISKKNIELYGKNYEAARISIKDTQLSNDLIKHGCFNNKAFFIQMPVLDEHLMRHFIRGFFDGDGSLTVKKHKITALSFTSGSIKMLSQLMGYLKKEINLNDLSIVPDKRRKSCFNFSISSLKNRIDFLDYIYKDSTIFLDRKYKLYMTTLPSRDKLTEVSG